MYVHLVDLRDVILVRMDKMPYTKELVSKFQQIVKDEIDDTIKSLEEEERRERFEQEYR